MKEEKRVPERLSSDMKEDDNCKMVEQKENCQEHENMINGKSKNEEDLKLSKNLKLNVLHGIQSQNSGAKFNSNPPSPSIVNKDGQTMSAGAGGFIIASSDVSIFPSLTTSPVKGLPQSATFHIGQNSVYHRRSMSTFNNAHSRKGSMRTVPHHRDSIPAPSTPTRPSASVFQNTSHQVSLPSIWTYLKNELKSIDFDEGYAAKGERVANFLSVPFQVEKLLLFGYLICLDSFLYIFTILPIRIGLALIRFFTFVVTFGRYGHQLKPAQKCDLLKGLLIFVCCYMLFYTDSSRLYHSVRGQSAIKLYVIFNVLEICDKLCSAFGHDILDYLFSKATIARTSKLNVEAKRQFGNLTHFVVSLFYIFGHTMVLFYMVMTLNVAINSYSNALLTLLLSNQFVEIKGSVFKKFERENLFQLSCADIVERFQLSVFMSIITLRNYVELTGGGGVDTAVSYLYSFSASIFAPSKIIESAQNVFEWNLTSSIHDIMVSAVQVSIFPSFSLLSSVFSAIQGSALIFIETLTLFFESPQYKMIETLLTPVVMVVGTEIIVDWLKHAFISKFNHIKPYVYDRFMDSLCRDLVSGMYEYPGAALDQAPSVARRIGFVTLPLACLVIRVFIQTIQILDDSMNWSLLPVFSEFPNSLQLYPWKQYMSQHYVSVLVIFTGVILMYSSLLIIKVMIGMYLLNHASRRVPIPVPPRYEEVSNIKISQPHSKSNQDIANTLSKSTKSSSKDNIPSELYKDTRYSNNGSPLTLSVASHAVSTTPCSNDKGENRNLNTDINHGMKTDSMAGVVSQTDMTTSSEVNEDAAAAQYDEKLDTIHRFSLIKRIV